MTAPKFRSACFRLLLCALFSVGGFQAMAQVPSQLPLPVGAKLPDAPMSGLNGPDRKLSFYAGKPLIINVWASWCGPCRMEMASLERLAWSPMARDFVVIGISTDDHRSAALAYLRQSNASFNHYLDANLALENMLGANRLPLTVLVNAKGRVVKKVYGAQEWDSAQSQQMVRAALSQP
jgi:thiol-disulfide isomerase/thioredoxin